MGILTKVFLNLLSKSNKDKRASYIFYKIVDFINDKKEYTFQCINTHAIFHAKIIDIVFDIDLLYALHPIQACFVGIEYAKHFKEINSLPELQQDVQKQKLNKYSTHRYGKYSLCYQERKGDVCFTETRTGKKFFMDPRDIALSEELIREFDAAQAFYIGLFAGLKLNNPVKHYGGCENYSNRPNLKLIKG
jgi:hypothetical protein